MFTNIDIAIVIAFLIINLVFGIHVGRGIKTITEFAIGDRNFSTATIAATLIATWISGSYFTLCISQTYKEGIWFLPAAIGDIISSLLIIYIFAPRMKEFFGSISVAESMGTLFGKNVRIVTAICSIAQAIGMTALQIKVFSSVFSYFWDISSLYATCASSFVVIFYSAWGGVKSVTFTDKIQFLTFAIFIPFFFFFICKTFGDFEAISHAAQSNALLDYSQLINWENPKFFPNLAMFLWFLIPAFNSTTFQRLLMTKNADQMSLSFTIAAFGYGVIVLVACVIGIIILSINPNIEDGNVIMYVLDKYSLEGMRGLTVIGIIAMVMSTADSWINTGSVIFAHDLCGPLGLKVKNELLVSRIFSIFVGMSALLLVLFYHNLFALFTLQLSFYMPIVSVPLLFAMFGFRSSGRSVILGMFSGAMCVILWKLYIEPSTGVDSVVPSMFMNLIVLMSSHYILGEPGGWVGIKDDSDLKAVRIYRNERMTNIKNFFRCFYNINIFNFNITEYCKKYAPRNETTYIYFAFALLITTAVITFSLDRILYNQHIVLVSIIQIIVLFICISFVMNTLWPSYIKEKYMGLIWCISVMFGLAFISTFLALISKFSTISFAILILNLTIIGIIMRWQAALFVIILGTYLATISYVLYMGNAPDITTELRSMEWNIFYVIFALIGLSITFLKSRQDREEWVEEKNTYLENVMEFKDSELQKAIDLKYEFLRNLEHEANTPITGITSLGQVLWESYDLLSEKQRRQGLEDIAKSSERLATLVNNMVDLSKLSSLTYKLNIQKVNLGNLVKARLETCKKLYLNNKELEFVCKLDDNIIVECDPYYITRVLDNLIVNAIGYSKAGKVVLTLTRKKNMVEFAIQDQGLAVPASELQDIFGVFVVSSKTKTPAGGRGVGLALCKKSIEAHHGQIWAESNGTTGATFKFAIPMK